MERTENKGGPSREEMEKARESWRNLSPDEREAKLKEWRKRRGSGHPDFRNLSAEEREAWHQEMRSRFEQQLKELRRKKAEGQLNSEEQRQLKRMEEISVRFSKTGAGNGSTAAPPAKVIIDKPALER
jgi:hypothetical protein